MDGRQSGCIRGLSPRVRGNQLPPQKMTARVRSIPACAGEPLVGLLVSVEWPVYPRVCGGTRVEQCGADDALGLSPRVRGNRRRAMNRAAAHRSIPACAGEPVQWSVTGTSGTVYPRVCGGTQWPLAWTAMASGLSPRVRGNLAPPSPPAIPIRSIPACAGEPLYEQRRDCCDQVYPRVCGGTGQRPGSRLSRRGLSPRVRGNQRATKTAVLFRGSIPACAGEP